jgi:hypothetical protein
MRRPGTFIRVYSSRWELTARHEWDLGGRVYDGVQCEQHEVDGHDLDHWPQPHQSSAHAEPGEAILGNRSITNAPLAVFGVEALGDTIAAAIEADILTEREHRRVGRQFGVHGPIESLPIEQFL